MTTSPISAALSDLPQERIAQLFDADANRTSSFGIGVSDIWFDFSKTHLTAEIVERMAKLATQANLAGLRDDMFAGRPVNTSEGRAAEHCAERGEGAAKSVSVRGRFTGGCAP